MRITSRPTARRAGRSGVVAVLAALALLATSSPAGAAIERNYAAWTVAGTAGAFTGTADLGLAGFPATTFTSAQRVASTAVSATLTGSTPFGQAFGTSSGRQYLSLGTTTGNTSATTTTFSFATPTPTSGWGFALGDIDAESIRVSATGTDGSPVSVAALGFEGSFIYASGGTDEPTWDPSTGTLRGNPCPPSPAPPDCDTNGASGWFRPTVALRSLSLEFTVQSGAPQYQLWIAANSVVISGNVEVTPRPGETLPEVEVEVTLPDGSLVTSTRPDPETGDFTLPPVVAGPEYIVTVVRPEGWLPDDEASTVVPTADGSPPPVVLRLTDTRPVQAPAPTTTAPRPTTTTQAPRAGAALRFTG